MLRLTWRKQLQFNAELWNASWNGSLSLFSATLALYDSSYYSIYYILLYSLSIGAWCWPDIQTARQNWKGLLKLCLKKNYLSKIFPSYLKINATEATCYNLFFVENFIVCLSVWRPANFSWPFFIKDSMIGRFLR